jgi:hypothetical protein
MSIWLLVVFMLGLFLGLYIGNTVIREGFNKAVLETVQAIKNLAKSFEDKKGSKK